MSEASYERIQRLVIPMVRERSREPGDAWDVAAAELMVLAPSAARIPSADEIAKTIDPQAFDPPNDWTLGNVKAAQKRARIIADRVFALLATT
jgi:hypothetical protein